MITLLIMPMFTGTDQECRKALFITALLDIIITLFVLNI